jgi:hypothetical protein
MTNRNIEKVLGIVLLEVRRPLLIFRVRHANWLWRSRRGAGATRGLVGAQEGMGEGGGGASEGGEKERTGEGPHRTMRLIAGIVLYSSEKKRGGLPIAGLSRWLATWVS